MDARISTKKPDVGAAFEYAETSVPPTISPVLSGTFGQGIRNTLFLTTW